jgi:endonuclease/exonuclease/phosphatase family metal-dependent hydrolase
MKYLKYPLYLVLGLVFLFVLFVLYGTLSDYSPEEETLLYEQAKTPVFTDSIFDIMIWNIGYCGLGHEMDFFYDGGEKVRSDEASVRSNLQQILEYTASMDSCDFFLFQEVDVKSKRSYRINQLETLAKQLEGYHTASATNYDVFFVPMPVNDPYGKVLSGIATMGRMEPLRSVRHSFPGNYAWPKGTFMLDRCFLVNRYPLAGDRQLLVVNTHNSAYDDGTLRKGQMDYLHEFLMEEYEKGNYIIVGGDWNQTPAGFQPEFEHNIFDTVQLSYIEKDYLPGEWTWLYDPTIPTNRRLAKPYDPVLSPTTVIDFYLLSPNIIPVDVQGVHLGFVPSDHQPVLASVRLIQN